MQPVDWAILVVIALAVFGGLAQGFFRSVCGLAGLCMGVLLGAWNYGVVARLLLPVVTIGPAANALGFLLLALFVMGVFALLGKALSKTVHAMGLGCLDRLGGGAFGLLQGVLMVTLGIWVTVAFFPQAKWLAEARLPRAFFGVCHFSTHISPQELADHVSGGLKDLESDSPGWLHPKSPNTEN